MDKRIYNIYCDESCHLEHDGIKPMLLGCVWCPENKKDAIFARLREIKIRMGRRDGSACSLRMKRSAALANMLLL